MAIPAHITLVGAAHIDRTGWLDAPSAMGCSNPGRFEESAGGTSLNVASILAALGNKPTLVSRLGNDAAASLLRSVAEERGIKFGVVNHAQKGWVNGDYHTNSIEGLRANVKRSINGTHIHVSKKWLQTYLWEFEFRHNYRKRPHQMMDALLRAFPRPVLKPSR